ncbi:hypothetical protein E4U21_000059 [Claviceps maximensis]|nr:hypothetical protein E4U21_000059 [Claviceps maximensis]
MCQFVNLSSTLLGFLLLMNGARSAIIFPSKVFGGLLLDNRTISQVQCFQGGINTTDFTRGSEMLRAYCKNYKIAPRSPYVAIVGTTTAYVCSEVELYVCSGETLDRANEILTDKCGHGVAGHVRLGDANGTLYGRGVLDTPLCPKLATGGRMKRYQFFPLSFFVNGTRVGKW